MIIKKYKAKSEQEAILMARDELGPEAIVMNVKTIKPGGFMRLFKKPKVELTAAIDDHMADRAESSQRKKDGNDTSQFGGILPEKRDLYSEEAKNAIEEKINSIAKLLEQQMAAKKETAAEMTPAQPVYGVTDSELRSADIRDNAAAQGEAARGKVVELIHRQLVENEVKNEYADIIVEEVEDGCDKQPIDNALANVYQKIVLKLGEVAPLNFCESKPKIVFFVGNTGVGKTTTIAKLASKCKLEDKLSVAMLSVDTYRIAAIEQLKTYANILNAPMDVIYTPEDMRKSVEKYRDYDIIMVDTAGHSHRNEDCRKELKAIVDCVSEYEHEIYLVASITTKYSDLCDIAEIYGKLFDYRIIFTKLDETKGLGSILNLKLDTGKKLSYVTWGQNVPDDIGILNPQIIAKKLLGGTK